MKKLLQFIKDNSSIILRLMVTQLGITIFGLVVTIAAEGMFQNSGNTFPLALASCFSILFYLFLLYTHVKEVALKDEIRINAGRLKARPLYGLWISLVANSLNILLALVTIVSKLFVSNVGFFSDYAEGVEYLPKVAVEISAIAQMIAQMIQAMYLGLITLTAPGNPLLLLVIVLPALLVCTLTYAIYTAGGVKKFFAKKN